MENIEDFIHVPFLKIEDLQAKFEDSTLIYEEIEDSAMYRKPHGCKIYIYQ